MLWFFSLQIDFSLDRELDRFSYFLFFFFENNYDYCIEDISMNKVNKVNIIKDIT